MTPMPVSSVVERLREATTIRLSETASTFIPAPKVQLEAADLLVALERDRDAARQVYLTLQQSMAALVETNTRLTAALEEIADWRKKPWTDMSDDAETQAADRAHALEMACSFARAALAESSQ